jgi:hypothetical protein
MDMADIQTNHQLGSFIKVELEIIPIEEEEDDLVTLSLVEDTTNSIKAEVINSPDYKLGEAGGLESTSGADLIQLVVENLSVNWPLLTGLFGSAASAIELLRKQRRVDKIEMILEGKTLKLEGVDRYTAEKLLANFEEQFPSVTQKLTAKSTTRLIGKVSKKR